MASDERDESMAFRFDGAEIYPVDGTHSELQRAVMPIVGLADGVVEPFATGLCISQSMGLVLTAWHVVEEFIEAHQAELKAGTSHLAVVYESDEPNTDGATAVGGPLPVYSVSHSPGLDLALLRLFDVDSSVGPVRPRAVAPLGFEPPPIGDYCYGFGFPHLKGGPVRDVGGRRTVDFERTLHATGGRVIAVFGEGHSAHRKLPGPHFDCDAPIPSGLSGGPVHTDTAGICGVMSTSYAPFETGDRWASYVSLLAPLLAFPVVAQDSEGNVVEALLHELVEDGHITAKSAPPPRPSALPVIETSIFAAPA